MKYTILLLIILFSCKHIKKDTYTNAHFKVLNKKFDDNQKKEIRECSDIKCIIKFTNDNRSEFEDESLDLSQELIFVLDSLNIFEYRGLVLLIAYQKKINNETYSLIEILKEIQEYFLHEMKEADSFIINKNKNLSKAAKTTYDKYSKGDTICLLLPLTKSGNKMHIVYYSSYNYENFIDTLFLKGIILDKQLARLSEKYELSADAFKFNLRIVELENFSTLPISDDYQIGDEFKLELIHYGRPLESCE